MFGNRFWSGEVAGAHPSYHRCLQPLSHNARNIPADSRGSGKPGRFYTDEVHQPRKPPVHLVLYNKVPEAVTGTLKLGSYAGKIMLKVIDLPHLGGIQFSE